MKSINSTLAIVLGLSLIGCGQELADKPTASSKQESAEVVVRSGNTQTSTQASVEKAAPEAQNNANASEIQALESQKVALEAKESEIEAKMFKLKISKQQHRLVWLQLT